MIARILVALIALATVAQVDQARAQLADSSKAAAPAAENAKAARVVIATVNSKPVYKDEIERAVKAYVGNQTVDPAMLPTLQATFLKQRIENDLLNAFLMAQ
jgi:hypothetical protein